MSTDGRRKGSSRYAIEGQTVEYHQDTGQDHRLDDGRRRARTGGRFVDAHVRERTGSVRGRVLLATLALLAAGCTVEADPTTDPTPAASSASGSSPLAASSDSEASTPSPSRATAGPPSLSPRIAERSHPVSLPALFEKRYDGRRLRLGEVLVRTAAYTQRAVTYRSDGLRVSGIMNVPHGRGPFPVLVLAHGYIDPAVYVRGQGLRREQDWLARSGHVVLHVDYRNHALSSRDPRAERRLRLGYTVDVINAVHAVRRSPLRFVDDDRVGLLGRSMGGGVLYNVLTVAPGLFDAAVAFAPVSSWTPDNFNRWIRDDPGRAALTRHILRRFGAPERPRSREFWREVSPRTYFHRVTEPVLIHHGTADESCPIRWSRQTLRAMRRAGVDARMFTYPGEPHTFIADWPQSMRRTVRFFRRHLG